MRTQLSALALRSGRKLHLYTTTRFATAVVGVEVRNGHVSAMPVTFRDHPIGTTIDASAV